MKASKISRRVEWIKENEQKINEIRKANNDHSKCRGECGNGATCQVQSGGGWGFWVQAFRAAGVNCNPMKYWSGSAPTPSTSINGAIADFIYKNCPAEIR